MESKDKNNKSIRNERIARSLRISKAKEDMTVKIIQHNRIFDRLSGMMKDAMKKASESEGDFSNQRELYIRTKMLERILQSGIKLMEQNRLQFYMINDDSLEGNEK